MVGVAGRSNVSAWTAVVANDNETAKPAKDWALSDDGARLTNSMTLQITTFGTVSGLNPRIPRRPGMTLSKVGTMRRIESIDDHLCRARPREASRMDNAHGATSRVELGAS